MLKTLKRSPVWMFLSLTLIFSAIVLVMLLFSGDETVFIRNILVGFYFACPGLAAIAASIINFHSLKNLGWGSSKSKRLLLVYFLPLLYGALIYAPVWLFIPSTYLGNLIIPDIAGSPDLMNQLLGLFIIDTLVVLGEEIGWRGLLAPELFKEWGFVKVSLFVGAVSFIWYLFGMWVSYGTLNIMALDNWGYFFAGRLGLCFVYTWLRLKSGSLWPSFLLHAGNQFIMAELFGKILTSQSAQPAWWFSETGLGFGLVTTLLAVLVWRFSKGLEKEQPEPISKTAPARA